MSKAKFRVGQFVVCKCLERDDLQLIQIRSVIPVSTVVRTRVKQDGLYGKPTGKYVLSNDYWYSSVKNCNSEVKGALFHEKNLQRVFIEVPFGFEKHGCEYIVTKKEK